MRPSRREVVIAPGALHRMLRDKPSEEEREALHNVLADLADIPLLGYEIAFFSPLTYRVDAGRFHVHYRFDPHHVWVEFIGAY